MTFRELIESNKISTDFEKQSGIKKDSKKIGNGDVYYLKDGSSIVIGANGKKIDYYNKNMDFITSYITVKQAIKALDQSGLINEGTKLYVLKCDVKTFHKPEIQDIKKHVKGDFEISDNEIETTDKVVHLKLKEKLDEIGIRYTATVDKI